MDISAILQSAPNLGASALIVVLTVMFLKHLAQRDRREEKRNEMFLMAISERDTSFRQLEKEVRVDIMAQLGKNTSAMERIMEHLNYHKNNK